MREKNKPYRRKVYKVCMGRESDQSGILYGHSIGVFF